jgi:hypothetical protein
VKLTPRWTSQRRERSSAALIRSTLRTPPPRHADSHGLVSDASGRFPLGKALHGPVRLQQLLGGWANGGGDSPALVRMPVCLERDYHQALRL